MTDYFSENKAQAGHGWLSARTGARCAVIRAVNGIFQLALFLILARQLTPEDYGLVAMVLAFTGFAPLIVDLGTRDAVIQKPRITESELAALFWITVAVGLIFTLLMAVSSPLIAWFYHEPRLLTVTLVSSLTFLSTALACQHNGLLRRAMRFQTVALIEFVAGALSVIIAIAMAWRGWHYWSLIIRPIALHLLNASGVWLFCRWVPAKPALTSSVGGMLKFGVNVIGFSLTDFFKGNSDRVAIGRGYGAERLGHYQNAFMVYDNLLGLTTNALDVATGSLSKLVHDVKEFRRVWSNALSAVTFYAMPAFGIMAVTSQDVIVLLLGSKWSTAGVLLSVLAMRGIPHVVERTIGWLFMPAGRSDRLLRWGFISTSAQLAALFAGMRFGFTGVVVAYTACMYLLFLPAVSYAGRPLGIGAAEVIKAAGPQLFGAVTSAAIGFFLRYAVLHDVSGIERSVALAIVYAVSYVIIVVGAFKVRMPLKVAIALGEDLIPRRFSAAKAMGKGVSMKGPAKAV